MTNSAHTNPTPQQIREARKQAGLTQVEAATLLYSGERTWQHWENGDRAMHPVFFEMFLLKTKQGNEDELKA